LVTSAFVLAGDVSSLVSLMGMPLHPGWIIRPTDGEVGIIEYAVVFLTLIGLLYLRLRPKPVTEASDTQPILKVPFVLIPIALLTVTSMVVVSTIYHPRAGMGFFACFLLSGLIHTFVVRLRSR
jgi:hypothetical protein